MRAPGGGSEKDLVAFVAHSAALRADYEARRLAWRRVFEAWMALPIAKRVREARP